MICKSDRQEDPGQSTPEAAAPSGPLLTLKVTAVLGGDCFLTPRACKTERLHAKPFECSAAQKQPHQARCCQAGLCPDRISSRSCPSLGEEVEMFGGGRGTWDRAQDFLTLC